MQKLIVEIPQRSYPIVVADGLLANVQTLRAQLRPHIRGNQVAIITNEVVAPLYLDQVMAALDWIVELSRFSLFLIFYCKTSL